MGFVSTTIIYIKCAGLIWGMQKHLTDTKNRLHMIAEDNTLASLLRQIGLCLLLTNPVIHNN